MPKAKPVPRFVLPEQPTARGSCAEGCYYKISDKLGVKVCGPESWCEPGPDKTAEVMDKINSLCPGVFPKCYGVVTVKIGQEVAKGVLMEHIDGETFATVGIDPAVDDRVIALRKKLNAAGIFWGDDHNGNILLTPRGNVRFVDPAYLIEFCHETRGKMEFVQKIS